MSSAEVLGVLVAPQIFLAVGELSLNCCGMLALVRSLGGHSGISFSFKYRKLIQEQNNPRYSQLRYKERKNI